MRRIDLGIKFGSNEIIIYRKGLGIIAKEPAFLAVDENGNKMKVKAYGKKAEKMFMSKSSSVTIYQPIKNSEIINEKMAIVLLSKILEDVLQDKFLLTKLNAVVAVPCAVPTKSLKILKNVLHKSGVSSVSFVQNAVCVRKNYELEENDYLMVVDIGKYITDVSVLSANSFETGRMHFYGGAKMDESITTFISDNHGLLVSDETSEAVKNEIASLYDHDTYRTYYIGIDENDKFVKHVISANEVKVAIYNIYEKIVQLIQGVMNNLPKEISKNVHKNGVVFVGGASSISGLFEFMSKKLDCPVIVPDDPSSSVVLGLGKLLNEKDYIKIEI